MNKIYRSIKNDSTGTSVAVGENAKGGGTSLKRKVHATLASASLAVSAAVAMASSADALANETVSSATYQSDIADYADTSNSVAQGSEGYYPTQLDASNQVGEESTDDLNHVAGQEDTMNNIITPGDVAGMGTSKVKVTRLLGSSADPSGSSQLLGAGLLQATAGADIAFGAYAGQTETQNGRSMSDAANAMTSTAIAVGRGSQANVDSISIGVLSEAISASGVSIGMKASTINGTAIGWTTTASGNGAVAIGNHTFAANTGSVAVGSMSDATGSYAAAFGTSSKAAADHSVALGDGSLASRANTVSVGAVGAERQIVNVRAGTEMTDAVNFAQLQAMSVATGATPGGSAFGAGTGAYNQTFNRADTDAALALELNSIAYGRSSIANSLGVSVGVFSEAQTRGVALGFGATAVTAALTAGYRATASGIGATALGTQTSAAGANSVALGITSKAVGSTSAALGASATATADGSTALGSNSIADRANTISVGAVNSERQIVNVKAGTSSTDAVNVAQLKAVGMTADASGTITNAFAAYDDTSKNSLKLGGAAGTIIGNVKAGVASMDAVNVAQLKAVGMTADASGTITNAFAAYDDTSKNTLKLGGANGTIIGNVKAGVGSTDAVNVAQLKAVGMTADASGTITNAFAAYDDTSKNSLKLGGAAGTIIGNVKAGVTSMDAVNVAQLKAVGMTSDASGTITNAFAAYDDTKKDTLKLGGTNGTIIGNVKAGVASTDAVNVAPLKAVGMTADASGTITNAFAAYDDTKKDTLRLGGTNGTIIGNVKAGVASTDAVNVAQLKAVGMTTDAGGATTNAFVAYDDTSKDTVNLGGTNGTIIGNLKAGVASTDAVNVAQLKAVGMTTDAGGAITNAFVVYDDTSKDTIKLGGTNGTIIGNVKAGVASTDAVNVAQLKAAGMTTDEGGTITNAFVAYDDTSKDTIKLGGTDGTIIGNVKAGKELTDAVNVGQLNAAGLIIGTDGAIANAFVAYDDTLKDTITLGGTDGTIIGNVKAGALTATSLEAVNGSQLFDTSSRMVAMLGGGASIDTNGSLLAPTYKVGGTEVHDVGSAIGNLDGRVTQNSSDIAGILGALASGSTQTPNPNPDPVTTPVTPDSTANPNGLAYDSAEHDRVTLGGFNVATAPVKLSNVADGDVSSSSSDAVNGAQLSTTNVRVSATENAIAGYQAAGLQFVMVNSSTDSGSKPSASGQDSIAIGSNAQASGNNAVAIGANSVADDSNVVSVGSADNERRVTNLAAGVKGTDAVNVNQMNQLRDDVGASMRSLQRSAFAGVAAAMAMPNLMPSAPGKVVMAAGVGNIKGYGAFGAGATYRSGDGKWLVNGAVSVTGGGDAGARAQVGYEF